VNELSICAGYGGIGLGLGIAVPAARTVCFVEREAAACEVLASRMQDKSLDRAPIWTDLTTFDGKPWRGAVDIISAGIPCQPWSVGGKQAGLEDERHLGEELVRVVGEVGPNYVFVENVSGFVRQGAPDLLGRLASLGFDAEWGLFSASGVGATHRRQRFFLLAYSSSCRWRDFQQREPEGREANGVRDQGQAAAADDGAAMVHTPFPPGPNGDWSGIPEEYHPAIESQVRGVVDGTPGRVDQLRMLGNGVVPLVAAHAFRSLLQRINH